MIKLFVFIFVYGLFNYWSSNTDFAASVDWLFTVMNWKGMKEIVCDLINRLLLALLGGPEESHEQVNVPGLLMFITDLQ
jgi:hypothetical protein